MKYLLYTDPHWCACSSIIRSRGNVFTTRLENLIKSLNWAEDLAITQKCDEVICLGDFFDKPELNAEEITALNKIQWCNLPHSFIVGNHESNLSSLIFSSTNALSTQDDLFHIISKPSVQKLSDHVRLIMLPYILEEDRKSLKEYLTQEQCINIVLSHNDIKGIQYGGFLSKIGFDLKDIEDNCSLFINGHLHNGTYLDDKKTILNLGNLTGLNFGEDAFKYKHQAAVLDTDTLKVEFFTNPYAFNFFKLEVNNQEDLNKYIEYFKAKPINCNNPIITVKCKENMVDSTKAFLTTIPDLVESKILINAENKANVDEKDISQSELAKDDHLDQFSKFVIDKLGKSDIIEEELSLVCKEDI